MPMSNERPVRTKVVSGIGHVYGDVESPAAVIDGNQVSVVSIASDLGAEVPDWSEVTAFEATRADPDDPDGAESIAYWSEHIAEYRERTGREFPKAYRLRVTVEVGELSDDETRAYWTKRAEGRS